MLQTSAAVCKLVTAHWSLQQLQQDSYKIEPCLIFASEPMKCAQGATCTIHFTADLQIAQSNVLSAKPHLTLCWQVLLLPWFHCHGVLTLWALTAVV